MRARLVLATSLAAVTALGCARNAVHEVELVLPAAPAATPFARVSAHADDLGGDPFTVQWDGEPFEDVTLSTAQPTTFQFGITADAFRGDALVRVEFCAEPQCARLGTGSDPQAEVQLRVETPFYTGAATQSRLVIPEVPSGTAPPNGCTDVAESSPTWGCVIERCRVAGCVDTGNPTNFCIDDVHRCAM